MFTLAYFIASIFPSVPLLPNPPGINTPEIFNKKWDLIKKQGFDLKFKRMWEFYLSYCEAGFKSKNIDLIQFSLQNK